MVRLACALTVVLTTAFAPACNNPPPVDPAEQAAQMKKDLANAAARVNDEKWEEANGMLTRVLEAEPGNPEALALQAKVRLFGDKDVPKALELVDRAIATKGDVPDYHATRALALQKSGKDAEAAASWGKAAQLDPDNGNYGLHQGQALRRAKQFEQAEAVFREVIKNDEAVKFVYSELGDALREQGKLDEALTAYAKGMIKYQGDKTAHAGAAQVYEAKGDTQKAIDEWSTYIRMDCCSDFSNNVAKKRIAELQQGRAG
ncbi:tetratricopeptide repeat protein [Nannocystis bainbridge]|uniref:Tetratricopeptide repeat protein n=1 Tax=Nannocystis bainbridge TaxID=2995303 RepID=A0ABT5E3R3_9BACT|nr:tetratricopeptide repeat protein [Nannocystis bainbridge]MDC0719371.1 tetratricopeptide repeat protein [Nannocystis bainbridge]